MRCDSSAISEYNDKILSELYSLNTLVNMTKNYCQELEFQGQYYGADQSSVKKLSNERNEYLIMLNLIRCKLDEIINYNLNFESKLL